MENYTLLKRNDVCKWHEAYIILITFYFKEQTNQSIKIKSNVTLLLFLLQVFLKCQCLPIGLAL